MGDPQQLRAAGEEFDALVIVDADCVADASQSPLMMSREGAAGAAEAQLPGQQETPFTR
ncbi:MAG: hypothetical protein U0231_15315 [Nitrospiraceae bacterium]